jgi:hypothetical protein
MTQIRLDRARVVAVVDKLVAAGMAQHMGVRLDAQIGHDSCPLDHAGEAGRREWRASFRHKHEGRLRAFLLVPTKLAHLTHAQRMRSWRAVLGTANVIRISSRSQRTSTIRPFVGQLRPDLALSPDDERVNQS